MTYKGLNRKFFPQFPPVGLVRAPSWILAWLDRQQQRAALAHLDERLLVDIGVTRDEAVVEIRRWD